MALPTSKSSKVNKQDFFSHAVEINRLEEGLGTFANPVTDPNAARPAGLLYVVWKCQSVPTNWQVGDFNVEIGS